MQNLKNELISWMFSNPNEIKIPNDLIENYNEKNNLKQTPLMLAAQIGNINFVKQLAPLYVGFVDTFGNCAYNYALKSPIHNQEVINYLCKFENYGYNAYE